MSLLDGLILHWLLNDNAPSTIVDDSATFGPFDGTSRHGNTDAHFDIDAPSGFAGSFSSWDTKTWGGIDALYTAADILTTGFTVSMFFKAEYLGIRDYNIGLFSYLRNPDGDEAAHIFFNDYTKTFEFVVNQDGGSDNATFTKSDLAVNIWYKIHCVFDRYAADGKRLKLYINSVKVKDAVGYDSNIPTQSRIWARVNYEQYEYKFCDVNIWNRALTESEINPSLQLELLPDEADIIGQAVGYR